MVVIGPNSVGKSQLLKDIAAILCGKNVHKKSIVVKDVSWSLPENIEVLRRCYEVDCRVADDRGNLAFRNLAPELVTESVVTHGAVEEWPKYFGDHIKSDRSKMFFPQYFGSAMFAFLTTETRLNLVKESASASHEKRISTLLQNLYNCGRETEREVRKRVKQVFGQEVGLDFTALQRLKLRVGSDFDSLPPDPRDARARMEDFEKLDEQGDGIRAFVGLVVAMVSVKRSVFLIDEPELFLHPPQAFQAGGFIAEMAGQKRQVIVTTHSTDVLRGILSRTREVTIVRVDRIGDENAFSRLDPSRLKELVANPLLSAARVLDGLFYPAAIVVEGDADARFYFAAANKRDSNIDMYIVNAGNKQTVSSILALYREMGIRCAGIVDFDVLNEHAELKKHLTLLCFPPADATSVLSAREKIANSLGETPVDDRLEKVRKDLTELVDKISAVQLSSDADSPAAKEKILRTLKSRFGELVDTKKKWSALKKEGRNALPLHLQDLFDRIWEICAESGFFINACGELESTLSEHGAPWTNDKQEWIRKALVLLPRLEVDDKIYPWKLVKAVQEYLALSQPLGTVAAQASQTSPDRCPETPVDNP